MLDDDAYSPEAAWAELRVIDETAAASPDLSTYLTDRLSRFKGSELSAVKAALRGGSQTSPLPEGVSFGVRPDVEKAAASTGARLERLTKSDQTKGRREVAESGDIFEQIRRKKAATRIIPDPVRTDRDENFVCGNALDGSAYTIGMTTDPRAVLHWMTLEDLDAQGTGRPGAYQFRVGDTGAWQALTLRALEALPSLDKVKAKLRTAPAMDSFPLLMIPVGSEDTQPFTVTPLAVDTGVKKTLVRQLAKRGEDASSYRASANLKKSLQVLRSPNSPLAKSARGSADYDFSKANLVGLYGIDPKWVKSKGSKSMQADGTPTKLAGSRGSELTVKGSVPSEIQIISYEYQEGGAWKRGQLPNNTVQGEYPFLLEVPLAKNRVRRRGDASVLRPSRVFGFVVVSKKDVIAQALHEQFRVFARRSPKDRNPYFSWVPERPGQFPALTNDKKILDSFNRPCPTPKHLEYLEAIKNAGRALQDVLYAGKAIQSGVHALTRTGLDKTVGEDLRDQYSTLYFSPTKDPSAHALVAKLEGYLQQKASRVSGSLVGLAFERDRIAEGRRNRAYGSQKAVDYKIFRKVDLLDSLLTDSEQKAEFHSALKAMKKAVEELTARATKYGLIEKVMKEKKRRFGKKEEAEKYVSYAAQRTPVYPPGLSPAEYVAWYGKTRWATGAVTSIVPHLEPYTWTSLPVKLRANVADYVRKNAGNYCPDSAKFLEVWEQKSPPGFFSRLTAHLQAYTGPSSLAGFAGSMELKEIGSYEDLLLGLLGLTAYQPLAPRDDDKYGMPYCGLIHAMGKLAGGLTPDESAYVDMYANTLLANRDFVIPAGAPVVAPKDEEDLRIRVEEIALGTLERISFKDTHFRGRVIDFFQYLAWREWKNRTVRGWRGGSNNAFANAVAAYFYSGMDGEEFCGNLSAQYRVDEALSDPSIWLNTALQATGEMSPAEAHLLVGILDGKKWLDVDSDDVKVIRDELRAKGKGALAHSFVRTVRNNQRAERVHKGELTIELAEVSRTAQELAQRIVAGGHGLEESSRRYSRERGIKVYYTYNPLLYQMTRLHWSDVTKGSKGYRAFRGFYHEKTKADGSVIAIRPHPEVTKSVDYVGFYGMMLLSARQAALAYQHLVGTPVSDDDTMQEAWNLYWDEQLGPEESESDVPESFSQWCPRPLKAAKRKALYDRLRNDLVRGLRLIKTQTVTRGLSRAARVENEGLHAPGSFRGVGGAQHKVVRSHGGQWVNILVGAFSDMREVLAARLPPGSKERAYMAEGWDKDLLAGKTDLKTQLVRVIRATAPVFEVPGSGKIKNFAEAKKIAPAVADRLYALRAKESLSERKDRLHETVISGSDVPTFDQSHLRVAFDREELRMRLLNIIERKLSTSSL